jgi:hypothetical protein
MRHWVWSQGQYNFRLGKMSEMEALNTFTKSSIRDCAIATTQSRPVVGRRSDGEVLQTTEEARNLRLCGQVTCPRSSRDPLGSFRRANFRAAAASRLRLHSLRRGKGSPRVKQWELSDQPRPLGAAILPVNL